MTKFEPDEALIRRLAALLEETGLSEIEYEADGRRIRVGRGAGTAFGAATAPSPAPAPQAEPAPEGEEALPPGAVTSPMVGTVYAAAEPGAAPLFKV
ncbi:MAG: acetyl-CoA carboxylase biotin carboxyl carrier protein, partial [Proteobacteria bacterium]|nr:acetyl-CoA carboxylase biotin carboxyl carrier protein [Pseudomonadota bacterium]